MSRLVVKCPVCEHKESVMSSRPGGDLPPCPRCEDFVRMVDVTPGPDQTKQTWSTAGSQAKDEPTQTPSKPVQPVPKRRDMRDLGPEPRT
jgi:hypothetical protein